MVQQTSGQWHFGFKCAKCSNLITVEEDESKGQKGFRNVSHGNGTDQFLLPCPTCEHQAMYPIEE